MLLFISKKSRRDEFDSRNKFCNHQTIVKNCETRDAPFVVNIGKITNGKLKPIMEKLNNIHSVSRNGASLKKMGRTEGEY